VAEISHCKTCNFSFNLEFKWVGGSDGNESGRLQIRVEVEVAGLEKGDHKCVT
jgi:hypothetical protein